MDRPTYPFARIQSVQSLCRALRLNEPFLRSVAGRASKLYIGPKQHPKKNGGFREVFDTKPPLKPLLQNINREFLKRVVYPAYLTGSLAGRDFVANVGAHSGARIAITEDIQKFFDHISADHVYRIWREFFGFGDAVSQLLTALTTKDGYVCQGTPTSSFLANLVFWEREPALVERLAERGIRYTRYVDDVTMSSAREMTPEDKTWAIAQVYGMVTGTGFQVRRDKHRPLPASRPITIMGLNANSKDQPTLTPKERSDIRAMVFHLEMRVRNGESPSLLDSEFRHASGKIARLQRLHPQEAAQLRRRVMLLREPSS